MATDKKEWQEVDPRVEWAMKVFDWGEIEPNNMLTYYAVPFLGGFFGTSGCIIRNHFYARPLWAGAPFTLGMGVAGFFGFKAWRDWKARRMQDEHRVIKHYIMTHPDKFIEPERIKYGDKRVFLAWDPKRN